QRWGPKVLEWRALTENLHECTWLSASREKWRKLVTPTSAPKPLNDVYDHSNKSENDKREEECETSSEAKVALYFGCPLRKAFIER
ncbi:jg158, partial [Pararge aegeria aegeria]